MPYLGKEQNHLSIYIFLTSTVRISDRGVWADCVSIYAFARFASTKSAMIADKLNLGPFLFVGSSNSSVKIEHIHVHFIKIMNLVNRF